MTAAALLANVSTLAVAPQGAAGSTGYTYGIVGVDARGKESLIDTDAEASGNAVLDETNFNRLTWTDIAGYDSYKIYRTISAGTPATVGLIGTVLAGVQTFDDTGLAGDASIGSAANTTGDSDHISLQGFNGDLNLSLQGWVDGTFQFQGSFGGDPDTGGAWLDEGGALAANTILVVTKKYTRIRVVTDVLWTTAPSLFLAGDDK
jgi:hypothetical protein